MTQRYLLLYQFKEKEEDAKGNTRYGTANLWTKNKEKPEAQARSKLLPGTELDRVWISDMHATTPVILHVYGPTGGPPTALRDLHKRKVEEGSKTSKPRVRLGRGGKFLPSSKPEVTIPLEPKVKPKPQYTPYVIYRANSWRHWYRGEKELTQLEKG
jgi:hypothetical protein